MFFREDFSGKHFGEINFLKTVPKNRCFQGKIFFGATPLKIGDRGVLSPGFYHKTGNMRFAREWPFLPFTELYRFFFNPGKNIHENFFPGKHSLKRPFRNKQDFVNDQNILTVNSHNLTNCMPPHYQGEDINQELLTERVLVVDIFR